MAEALGVQVLLNAFLKNLRKCDPSALGVSCTGLLVPHVSESRPRRMINTYTGGIDQIVEIGWCRLADFNPTDVASNGGSCVRLEKLFWY